MERAAYANKNISKQRPQLKGRIEDNAGREFNEILEGLSLFFY